MMLHNPLVLAFLCIWVLSFVTWLVSLYKKDASIVDSMWSIFFVVALVCYLALEPVQGPRTALVSGLLCLWAIRLSVYLTYRNWGQPEDRRYQAIRTRNQPHYALKSLAYVFTVQAVLAWIISLPIQPVIASPSPITWLDYLGIVIFICGFLIETIADTHMALFKLKRGPSSHRVLDQGLWRYSRHPNYFGETMLWWGFYLIALSAGAAWWIIISPLLMNVLLLKVSGVPMLEIDLAESNPDYKKYIQSTSPFIPRPPKGPST